MFSYILQVIICSTALYGYYHLFLRNEKFHLYNRYYLLVAILFSILAPLLEIPVSWQQGNQLQHQLNPIYWSTGENITIYIKNNSTISYTVIIYSIMLGITVILFLHLLLSVIKLIILKKKNNYYKKGNITFINTTHPLAPFSFFNWLFWNDKIDITATEGKQILQHEQYHIKQKHSMDVLFMEIVLCVFWFNPIFYLYRKEIKAIQEFLADQYASSGADEYDYAQLLVMQALNMRQNQLVNPFFHNQLKRRIMMLTNSKNQKFQYLKKVLMLPLFALLFAVFAFSYPSSELNAQKTNQQQTKNKVSNNTHSKKVLPPAKSSSANQSTKPTTTKKKPAEKSEDPEDMIFTKVEKEAEFPGGVKEWRRYLETNLNAMVAVDNGAPTGTYTVQVRFIVALDGTVSDVKAINKVGYKLDEETVRTIKNSGKWIPAEVNGKPVKAYRIQPISFQVSE